MSKNSIDFTEVNKQILQSFINVLDFNYLSEDNKVIKVKTIYGAPERAIAEIFQENAIILPLISVYQIESIESQERRHFAPVVKSQKWWNHKTQRAERVISLAPKAMDFIFQISLWGKYIEDINEISPQIRKLFNPSLNLETDLHDHTQVFLTEEEDSYTYDTGDGEDRTLVKTFTVNVETYIPYPIYKITSTGKIEEVVFDLEIRTG